MPNEPDWKANDLLEIKPDVHNQTITINFAPGLFESLSPDISRSPFYSKIRPWIVEEITSNQASFDEFEFKALCRTLRYGGKYDTKNFSLYIAPSIPATIEPTKESGHIMPEILMLAAKNYNVHIKMGTVDYFGEWNVNDLMRVGNAMLRLSDFLFK